MGCTSMGRFDRQLWFCPLCAAKVSSTVIKYICTPSGNGTHRYVCRPRVLHRRSASDDATIKSVGTFDFNVAIKRRKVPADCDCQHCSSRNLYIPLFTPYPTSLDVLNRSSHFLGVEQYQTYNSGLQDEVNCEKTGNWITALNSLVFRYICWTCYLQNNAKGMSIIAILLSIMNECYHNL